MRMLGLLMSAALAAACAEPGEIMGPDAGPDAGGADAPGDHAQPDVRSLITSDDNAEDICSLLPAEGPCELACDQAALIDEFVPAGVCIQYECPLRDGRSISVSACNPGP